MHLTSYAKVKHLLPRKSVYWVHPRSTWADDYDAKVVWFHDGDFDFSQPLNLDQVQACFGKPENETFPLFILINGNARFGNIFNAKTDGTTGLIVLGNLSADHIVVGGQEIFVAGDLAMKELFWGDDNHGNLTANGKISTRVFINTNYGTDYNRFKNGKNLQIEHLLTDEQEDLCAEGHLLRALFEEKFVLKPDELLDDVYSLKDWLKDWLILEALEKNERVLRQAWNADFFRAENRQSPPPNTPISKGIDDGYDVLLHDIKENTAENRFDLSKSTFITLIRLCLNEPHLSAATRFLEQTTEGQLEGRSDLLDAFWLFCGDNDISLLTRLDWKAEVEDFVYFLDRKLRQNFGMEIDLQAIRLADDLPLDKAMQQYDGLIRHNGLQLGFADDASDSYIFFVHPTEAAGVMAGLFEVSGLGYAYQEAQDL